ncbi:MAG: hypothetical protein EXQ59_05255 [Acidobacteria bacterium]|nr:hypothetical protein [Acidobacteriota bacterium]
MSAQLALYELQERRVSGTPSGRRELRQNPTPALVLCASCQRKEARYGFQPDRNDPLIERPRTLCFECFRLELGRRQDAARDVQAVLPLEQTLETLGRRRRQAQIAARRALGLR